MDGDLPTEFWATHSYTFSSLVKPEWLDLSTAPALPSNSIVCREAGRKVRGEAGVPGVIRRGAGGYTHVCV